MEKKPVDRARVDSVTKFVHANHNQLADKVKAVLVDDEGEPLPFLLLLPMGNGTATSSNLPEHTLQTMLRVVLNDMEQRALAVMFKRALDAGLQRVLDVGHLVVDEDEDDIGKKH